MGNAYLKWAFSEAVVLFLRETREAQPYIRRLERKYGTDKAKGILAHRLGRTVYYMLKHNQIFDINKFVNQQHMPGSQARQNVKPQDREASHAKQTVKQAKP
jgi:hypothetical protein